MSNDKVPVTIKKYANRRLYNTGTSAYVTLEDLATMVKHGDDFVVFDAKTGDDITRSVLAQIIFEQEAKDGQSLLPITFLRQLIRFYGDSMQMLVPSYLEFSLDKLTKEKSGFAGFYGNGALTDVTRPMFAQIEEQTRQNMTMFRQALSMFTPFSMPSMPLPGSSTKTSVPSSAKTPAKPSIEITDAPSPPPSNGAAPHTDAPAAIEPPRDRGALRRHAAKARGVAAPHRRCSRPSLEGLLGLEPRGSGSRKESCYRAKSSAVSPAQSRRSDSR